MMIIRWFGPLIWAVFLGCVADVWTTISNMATYGIWGERNLLITPENFVLIAFIRIGTPLLIVVLDIALSKMYWVNVRKPIIAFVLAWALFFTWVPVLINLGVVSPEIVPLVCVYCR